MSYGFIAILFLHTTSCADRDQIFQKYCTFAELKDQGYGITSWHTRGSSASNYTSISKILPYTTCAITCKNNAGLSWRFCNEYGHWTGPSLDCSGDIMKLKRTRPKRVKRWPRIGRSSWSPATPPPPDRTPPYFTVCPSTTFTVNTPINRVAAIVKWQYPVATDARSGVTITQTPPTIVSGSTYYEGFYQVVYTAKDSAGNTAKCTVSFIVKVRRCAVPASPTNGHVQCDSPLVYGKSCSFWCFPTGHYMVGNSKQSCMADGRLSGGSVTCKKVTCGNPGNLQNGRTDASSYEYGAVVTYNCNLNYNLTDGDRQRHCKQAMPGDRIGYWSGKKPSCIFVKSCNSNPCQNGGTCEDGYNHYTCICKPGWSGTHCEFDILPPTLHDCPSNMTFFTDKRRRNISWVMPRFTEPMGGSMILTKNYDRNKAELPWGVFLMQYTAMKPNNGMRSECLFTTTVLPYPCKPIPVPKHGAVACNGWNRQYSQVCKIFCAAGKESPIGFIPSQLYVCGASGSWKPSAAGFDECEDVLPKSKLDSNHYAGSCQDLSPKHYIADVYIKSILNSAFREMCTNDDWKKMCIKSSVVITC